MSAVIIDIDGTLAEISHRLHHVRNRPIDWDAFFAGIPDDSPCDPIVQMSRSLGLNHEIILATGRPERCREDTEVWLFRHMVSYDELYMRRDNDHRPDHIVKSEILDDIRVDGFEPFLVIDDRQSVVDMWRERGLMCLQCVPDQSTITDKAKLILMVGPSGGGKSTWLDHQCKLSCGVLGIEYQHVISSDQVRKDWFGTHLDQSRNEEVFAAVNAVATARLKHDLPVVIDATHLRRKDRVNAVALAQGNCQVHYIVINRPMEMKYRDAGWRAELDFDLIAKHEQTFNSQIKDILAGDGLPNVMVHDHRPATA